LIPDATLAYYAHRCIWTPPLIHAFCDVAERCSGRKEEVDYFD